MARYLLPCSCGKQIPVESVQAGQTVTCQCGNRLEVPTMRGLAALARAEDARDTDRATDGTWSSGKGLALAGFLLAAVSIGTATYLYVTRPKPVDYTGSREAIIDMPAAEALQFWGMIETHGINLPQNAHEEHLETSRRRRTAWIALAGGLGVVGLAMLVAGLLWNPSSAAADARRSAPG